MVVHLIQGGHIDPGNLGGLPEEFPAAFARFLAGLIQVDDLQIHFLSGPQAEQVDKIRQGLRVADAGAAGNDNGVVLPPLAAAHRDTAQIQHIEDVGVAHLVLEGKAHKVKLGDGVPAFQAVQGKALPAHERLHVHPGGKHPLAPDVLPLVHQAVEDFHAQMGHPDFIGIGETKSKPGLYPGRVFPHGVELAAYIPARLLDLG